MERITKWDKGIPQYDGRFKKPGKIYYRTQQEVEVRRNLEILKLLAQYEDTGLTPAEVELLKKSAGGHLLDLFRAEIENRLIVSPVGPGGHLYLPAKSPDGPTAAKAVVQCVWASKGISADVRFTIRVEVEELEGRIYEFSDRLIGKEFFLTEKEAIEDSERRERETTVDKGD